MAEFCRNSIFSKMEEKEEKKQTTSPNPSSEEGSTHKKSNRDTFMERYKADYPDDNFEDEEAMYGRMNERTAAYDRLKTNDDNFRKLVNEHPEYGGMVADMMEGRNFIESFLGRFSKDDILAAYEDEAMAKKLADAQAEYLKGQEDSKKLREEGDANVQESIARLQAYCEAHGIDEAGATELWGKCLDFGSDVLKGIFTDDLFDIVSKGMSHDEDVAAAREEGEIAGHNAKVQTQLAKGQGPGGIPPTFDGGQGKAAAEPKPKQKKKVYDPFSHEEIEV